MYARAGSESKAHHAQGVTAAGSNNHAEGASMPVVAQAEETAPSTPKVSSTK